MTWRVEGNPHRGDSWMERIFLARPHYLDFPLTRNMHHHLALGHGYPDVSAGPVYRRRPHWALALGDGLLVVFTGGRCWKCGEVKAQSIVRMGLMCVECFDASMQRLRAKVRRWCS